MEFWIAAGIGVVVLFCVAIYVVCDACFSNNKRYALEEIK